MDIYSLRTGVYRNLNSTPQIITMPFYVEMIGVDDCRPDYEMFREKSPLSVVGYTTRGCGLIEQDGIEVSCKPGQFFILRMGGTHRYHPQKDWQYCWANVRGDLWSTLTARYGLSQTVIYDLPGEKFAKCVMDCADSNVSEESAQHRMQAELFDLVVNMYENRTGNASALAQTIRDELDRCSLQNLTQEEICEKIGISVRHAQRVFREAYCQSMYEYICIRRVDHARQLLLSTDGPIAKIAEQVGFADEKSFITFFKRHTGQTPAHFRRVETNRTFLRKN